MNIDYDRVLFYLTEPVLFWFQTCRGHMWFDEIDPFLRAIRRTFADDTVSHAELYLAPDASIIYVKLIDTGGEVRGEQQWSFMFGERMNIFSRVA